METTYGTQPAARRWDMLAIIGVVCMMGFILLSLQIDEVTFGQGVVIGLRLIVPLLIFRSPLVGGVLAMLLDGADVIIVEQFGPGGMGSKYHQLDKYLDIYYLSMEAYVSLTWTELRPRLTSIGLFLYRLVGVVLFELTGIRLLLFIFPNLFENWNTTESAVSSGAASGMDAVMTKRGL